MIDHGMTDDGDEVTTGQCHSSHGDESKDVGEEGHLHPRGAHPKQSLLGIGKDGVGANREEYHDETNGIEGRRELPIGDGEEDEAYAHRKSAHVFDAGEDFAVHDGGDEHGGDQLAGSEDDLGGEVDVVQGHVGQGRRREEAKGEKRIQPQRCHALRFLDDEFAFEEGAYCNSVRMGWGRKGGGHRY